MNTLFATSASPVRRMVLAILLALSLVPLMLTGTAHAAQASTACLSQITSLSAFNTANHQTVYISGQCLGTNSAYTAEDSRFFYIHVYNGAQPWNACYVGDLVSCSISYWGENEIVFKGFAGAYGKGYVLYAGEAMAIEEMNPQDPYRWWTCLVYVGRTSNCSLASSYQGTGHNITVNITSNFALASVTEDQQGNISGNAIWTPPLYGSGPFTGKVYANSSLVFTSIANDGSGVTITFTGTLNANGSLSGNYTVSSGQIGTWQVSPA